MTGGKDRVVKRAYLHQLLADGPTQHRVWKLGIREPPPALANSGSGYGSGYGE